MGTSEPVKEALDHLLDPLDLSGASQEVMDDADGAAYSRARSAELYASTRSRGEVAAFLLRVRRSSRLLYKIPRHLLGWTALIVGLCVLIWVTFGFAGLR